MSLYDQECRSWNTVLYLRISKEDGDKGESDSITNQRELIKDHIKKLSNINIISERIDDGYSGATFERPAFMAMMKDIRHGYVNCVIVKDLSRFGRNFIESGKYLEQIFPFLGVRFISVTDQIDSLNQQSINDNLIIPFKNLINDAYCRDISIKIRSQLAIKRKKGDFIGSFAAYGYIKDKQNHNRLVVDEYAAHIVQEIFEHKLDGKSNQGIADLLNEKGILSPLEYKRFIGLNYTTSFKVNQTAVWTATTVGRILKNEIYIGVLVQGKSTTPNHKIKNNILKPEDEWIKVYDSHEPIISKDIFNLVNNLMLKDMRISPNDEKLFLISGLSYCSDCNEIMIRKTVPSNNKKYFYYICGNSRFKKCSSHAINEVELLEAIKQSLKKQIEDINHERIWSFTSINNHNKGLNIQIARLEEGIKKYQKIKASLYESLEQGLINKTEFVELNDIYNKKIDENKDALERIYAQSAKIKYDSRDILTRKLIVYLIKGIYIFENKRIEIRFSFKDIFNNE